MRDSPVEEGRPARQMRDVLYVRRAHDAHVVFRDVHEDFVELDVLLGMGTNQVVIWHAGDRENRLAVELGMSEP